MQPLISVIMPVYNDEKHITRGIKCITRQTYRNLEIIVVDDGSTDNTGRICDEWMKKDSRIKVIHKENGGVSAARNDALDIAKGEYICFADSDDIVAPYFVEEAYHYALVTGADVVYGGARTTDRFNDRIRRIKSPSYDVFAENDKSRLLCVFSGSVMRFSNKGYLGRGVWGKLYKAELCRDLRFDTELTLREDTLFNTMIINKARTFCTVDQIWYLYCLYGNSASHRYKPESIAENEKYLLKKEELLDLESKEIRNAYISEIRDMMSWYVFPQYLFNPQCNLTLAEKHKLLDRMRKRKPWSYYTNADIGYLRSVKPLTAIDNILFKLRLYSLIYYKSQILTFIAGLLRKMGLRK